MNKDARIWLSALIFTGAVFLGGIPARAEGVQLARPDADLETSGWGTVPLFSKINEAAPDGTYVQHPSGFADFEVSLSDADDPGTSTGHLLRGVARRKNAANWGTAVAELREGGVVRASLTMSPPSSGAWQTFTHPLTVAEADSITDYSNLTVRVVHTAGSSVYVDQVEFEVPEAGPPPPPPPSCEITIQDDEPVHTEDLIVPAGDKLCFESGAQLIMDNSSILVNGTLEMRPGKGYIEFRNVNEAGFVAGGEGPTGPSHPMLDTDPGLWVMDDGVLDVQGSTKTPWTYEPGSATGWLENDELLATPVEPGDFGQDPFDSYDPGAPVPQVTDAFGTVHKAEIMNMTRDVVIRGQDNTHRAHIFIRSTQPQTIKHASFRFLGPRSGNNRKLTGRWALHFHHNHEASIGSVVEGNVVRDGGGHGIVAHGSDGVLIKRNIVYDLQEDAYWWDLTGDDPDTASENIDYIENIGPELDPGTLTTLVACSFRLPLIRRWSAT